MLIVSLALVVLTYFHHGATVFTLLGRTVSARSLAKEIDVEQAFTLDTGAFFRNFHGGRGWILRPFYAMAELRPDTFAALPTADALYRFSSPKALCVRIRAHSRFGFLHLLPSLIIDLVVAAYWMSMGIGYGFHPQLVSLPSSLPSL